LRIGIVLRVADLNRWAKKKMHPALRNYLEGLREFPGFSKSGTISAHSLDTLRNTPLHYAAIQGKEEVVDWLLDEGADPNAVGEHEFTPLHEAVQHGHAQIVTRLLNCGANPAMKTEMGDAFELAVLDENESILAILRK
jgi:uncharacterized protein